jgi:hypothetical protein
MKVCLFLCRVSLNLGSNQDQRLHSIGIHWNYCSFFSIWLTSPYSTNRCMFPQQIEHNDNPKTKQAQARVTLTYHSPLVWKITSLFKHSQLHTTFKSTSLLFSKLNICVQTNDTYTNNGVYKLTCRTCDKTCIGQTGSLEARFFEHSR